MKNVVSIFSWVASALLEGISPGCLIIENIVEGLKKYGESVSKIADSMQRSWNESIRTLKIALGENELLSPKSRKQIAAKFAQEVITPFAVKYGYTGERLADFRSKVLQQCRDLEKIHDKIIDFSAYSEDQLLENLSGVDKFAASGEEIGEVIINNIQNELPQAKELIQLLWFRNLLMEGLVAHFHLEISCNVNLSSVVSRLDRERIQKDLQDVKQQINDSMENQNFANLSVLGTQATRLSTIDQVCDLQEKYRELLGPVMYKLDELAQDHRDMNAKLDIILRTLTQLQGIQRNKVHDLENVLLPNRSNSSEEQLMKSIRDVVESIEWSTLPENHRLQIVNSLTMSLYDLDKIVSTITIVENLIEKGVRDARVYFIYFQMLQESGEHKKAIEVYNEMIFLNKNFALFPHEKYKMLEIVAKGRTGFVYKVLRHATNDIVAIKVLRPEYDSEKRRENFWSAVATAKRLDHSHIVKIYDVSLKNARHSWVAMEYLEGPNLQQKVHEKNLSFEECLNIAYQIGQAVGYAHKEGVIHGDLKPINFFYVNSDVIKIADFGLADWKSDVLLANEFYSSVYYSAPEKLMDSEKSTVFSDVYSFGKTLYYLFTGDEPYDMEWEQVPSKVKKILRKATRKLPEKRYSSLDEMLDDLEKVNCENLIEDELVESDVFPIFYVRDKAISLIPQYVLEYLPVGYKIVNEEIISLVDNAPMVYIPKGIFVMGDSSIDADLEEAPEHKVYLDAYLIDKFPVTNNRYKLFLDAIGQNPQTNALMDNTQKLHIPQFWYNSKWNTPEQPVVGIDWHDAQAYCDWSSKSLPTEAEWEKAARGTDYRYYPWGNDIPNREKCNFDNYVGQTSRVGEYPENCSSYRCYDMSGNVWEWCQDWYDAHYYNKSPLTNPQGPQYGKFKIARGGSWQQRIRKIRVTTRGYISAKERRNQIGFRTVKRICKKISGK
ncbi:SUMF1/EgtB/PvdO family nonheme iron enzyme [Candidatus Uabimicrobium sp. HlEnr_7]|uniref:SUMF1/EgtB/PvdO family nonheme iron enzyme n=1 Tax=Candidatus Uabimicrobium helgolandensis TaxID=3095367 RepID=UPI00355725D3